MKTAENPPAAKPAFSSALPPSGRGSSAKIQSSHLERLAIVYVRQSSPRQVLENRESTARQYAFADQAVVLGWPRDRVLIIDEDLGKSGRTAEGRSGFQRLVAEVTFNHVGLVLGLEMSRLARSSKDWHAFFEMCALFGTLIADEDGVYDGNDANDRLLLGLKGIMSEMELHIMRNRLERGRDNKAKRGELFYGVPMGYVILPTGEVVFDPDEQARDVMRLIFDKFEELPSMHGLLHWLIRNDIRLPIRPMAEPRRGNWTGGVLRSIRSHKCCAIPSTRARIPMVVGAPIRNASIPRVIAIGRGCRWSSGRCCSKTAFPLTSHGINI